MRLPRAKRQADALGDASIAVRANRERADTELAAVLARLGFEA